MSDPAGAAPDTISVSDSPSLVTAGAAAVWALRVRPPRPQGGGTVDHPELAAAIAALRQGGLDALARRRGELEGYLERLSALDPDLLDRGEALAFWLNAYNAAALLLALDAFTLGLPSALRIDRAFTRCAVTVAGERLSLHDIEHGKVRRFHDPRIHAALNCASRSCPPLPPEPFRGADLDLRLDARMRGFLAAGGLVADRAQGGVTLSKVFRWYGGDFVRPERMPLMLPASPRAVLASLAPWTDDDTRRWLAAAEPVVAFGRYDWGLAARVA